MLAQAIVQEVAKIKEEVSDSQATRVSHGLMMFRKWTGKDIALEKIDTALLDKYQRHRLKK